MQEDQMAESIKPGEEKAARESVNFIHSIIEKDLEDNLYDRPIKTRFPPEPNGYLSSGTRNPSVSIFLRQRNITVCAI